jgi:hypothetical protein
LHRYYGIGVSWPAIRHLAAVPVVVVLRHVDAVFEAGVEGALEVLGCVVDIEGALEVLYGGVEEAHR